MSEHLQTRRPASMTSRGNAALALLGGLAAIGLTSGVLARRRSRVIATQSHTRADDVAAFHAYLTDHLTGSDAAFAVIGRLRDAHAGRSEGDLFARLYQEFSEERAVVAALVRGLGRSPVKAKRLVGQAAGAVLQALAGGDPGDLALFRTLETLAIGVQGKRCLWRVAQTLEPALQCPGNRTFGELEALAVDQWRCIEHHRLALATRTFSL